MNDKSPTLMSSKKFRAFVIAELTWKIILAMVVLLSFLSDKGIGMYGFLSVMTIIIVAGFVEVSYLSKQAALDKYVQLATMAVTGATSMLSHSKGEGGGQTDRSDGEGVRKMEGKVPGQVR